ncbi:MAG: hypothetical protein DRI81_09770 [Chloroflexi bacterium]|nr:MAG: hypothetical protein DRI81_09770 [Chloroflexota bacterium]
MKPAQNTSSQQNRIEVADQDGWRKTFPLQKTLVHIGSDPGNDIVLESRSGGWIAGRCLQVLSLPTVVGYRLVNVGDSDILLGSSGERVLAPRTTADVLPGESIRIGEFTCVFRGGGVGSGGPQEADEPPALAADLESSDQIGISVSLSQTQLGPDSPIEGHVTVHNLGNQTGVQFKLGLEGLPPDCCEIGPGPILFPGATRNVPLRLLHPRRPDPLAGERLIRVRVTAPGAYEGEAATASQIIHLLPFYAHELRLMTPGQVEE